jgi:ribosomal protein S18 acetylase RimI-like enzyme
MAAWPPDVQPCPPERREAALSVLYQRVPESLRARLVADVLEEARCGAIDLSGLWIAGEPAHRFRRADHPRRILGALLTQPLAGRAAAVWAPEVLPSLRRQATATALVRAALADLQARGFRIAQAVLDESASRRGAQDLTRGGMPRVTELLYLERDTRVPLAPAPAGLAEPPRLRWQSFDPAREAEFRELLQATYRSSLDMPELEGARTLDDIIEGHRATGRFVPDRWQLGRLPGRPDIGVALLLSETVDPEAWEVVYLGLTPPARGCGLGRQTLGRALELTRPHAPRLELAVDVRNFPATRLYEAAGFIAFDRRAVHLVVFPEKATGPG